MSKFKEIINSEQPTLVDFYADWCAPCKIQMPILEELASKTKGKARILKIDVQKNHALSKSYGIRSIPTLLIFRKGKVIWRHTGLAQLNELEDTLRYHADNE